MEPPSNPVRINHRALFDLGPPLAPGAANLAQHLLDHHFDVRTSALVTKHAHVLEAHQRLEDLARVDSDEGASWF
jgi:hypothetical protein